MYTLSRRNFVGLLGTTAITSFAGSATTPGFRIRTITAGVELKDPRNPGTLQAAIEFLGTAKSAFDSEYEVQSTRLATEPLPRYLPSWLNTRSLDVISELDRLVGAAGAVLSVGPVLVRNEPLSGFASWASDLIQSTKVTSFSSLIASPALGVHRKSIKSAAEAIRAIAAGSPGGEGNFRYCASAFCPPGTPFFPAAYHEGPRAFSIGLESPRLLEAALKNSSDSIEASSAIRACLNTALAPVEAVAEEVSRKTGWRYLGIDVSPAPSLDSSIGRVIEELSGNPFGASSTLTACATITSALKDLDVKTCGYSGLMLPVLEDKILATRATENRYGVSELLLYSSVCGTGLDVVPLAGNTSVERLTATIGDVASLSARYRKPLSARLFPLPGREAGQLVSFDNPYLTKCKIMTLD